MPISTIPSKGQTMLPVRLRRQMKIKPNDPVTIEAGAGQIATFNQKHFEKLGAAIVKAKICWSSMTWIPASDSMWVIFIARRGFEPDFYGAA